MATSGDVRDRRVARGVAAAGPGVRRWVRTGDDRRRDDGPVHDALRRLVSVCRVERRPLPIVPMILAQDGRVEVRLAAPAGVPPRGWVAVDDRWRLDVDRRAAPDESLDAYPALVHVGEQDRASVYVDLAAAPGVVEIDGPRPEVRATMERIARSLSSAPWSQGVTVRRCEGTSVADVLPEEVRHGLPALGGASGRWGAPPRGSHTVLLVDSPLDDAQRRLVRGVSRWRGAPTVVAPQGEVPRGAWRWRVEPGVLAW